jgi:biopolymer transport protein ExbD
LSVKIRKSLVLQSLSLTPLVDVVFLLLIFFLVASRFAEEDRELNVELPTASEARPMVLKPDDIELSIDQAGNYSLEAGQSMSLPEVEAMLARAALNNPLTQTVVIRADRNCSWNHVAQALNVCYRAGLRDVKTSVANP